LIIFINIHLLIIMLSLSLFSDEKILMIFKPEGKTLCYRMSFEMEVNLREGILKKTLHKEYIYGNLLLHSGMSFGDVTPCVIRIECPDFDKQIQDIHATLDERGRINNYLTIDDAREIINGVQLRDILNNLLPKLGGRVKMNSVWSKSGELAYYAPAFDSVPSMKILIRLDNKYQVTYLDPVSLSAEITGQIALEGKRYNSDKIELSGKSKNVRGHIEFSNEGYFTSFEVEYKVETNELPLDATIRFSLSL